MIKSLAVTQQWPDSDAPLSRSFMTSRQQGFRVMLTRLEGVNVTLHAVLREALSSIRETDRY